MLLQGTLTGSMEKSTKPYGQHFEYVDRRDRTGLLPWFSATAVRLSARVAVVPLLLEYGAHDTSSIAPDACGIAAMQACGKAVLGVISHLNRFVIFIGMERRRDRTERLLACNQYGGDDVHQHGGLKEENPPSASR